MLTTEEFFQKLRWHDWYYNYSDDYSAYSKGQAERAELSSLCKENELFATMFSDYLAFINACITHGPKQEEVPLPVLEDYV